MCISSLAAEIALHSRVFLLFYPFVCVFMTSDWTLISSAYHKIQPHRKLQKHKHSDHSSEHLRNIKLGSNFMSQHRYRNKERQEERADCCVTEYIFSEERGLNSLMSQHLFSPAVIIQRGFQLRIEEGGSGSALTCPARETAPLTAWGGSQQG